MSEVISICPACGGKFKARALSKDDKDCRKKYCFLGCQRRAADYYRHHGTLEGLPVLVIGGSAAWKELNDKRRLRNERLARRDAEYAANAARVTVDCVRTTDGRTLVVESRGTCPCVGAACIRRQVVSERGQVYFA